MPTPPRRDTAGYTPRHLAERILTSRSALEGERKQVTVLFADCVSFTALSAGLDPEDLHDIMDGFFERVLAAVHAHEGTVNQFTGDGVMALFGAPIAHEDHARRAVGAALAIQRSAAEYGARLRTERGLELAVRIGLNSGAVVVGRIGDDLRMDYTAQGETVNLAARLQTAAPAGGVLVSDVTHRLVEGYFAMEGVGDLRLKGIERVVPAYLVLRPLARRTRFDLARDRGLTPLVGRHAELRFLADCLDGVRSGRGRVVSLVGDGGVGKSRLVWELRRSVEGEAATPIEAQGLPHDVSMPFHIVVQLLERLLDLDGDAPRMVGERVDEAVARLGAEFEWTRPHVRQLLSLPADAGAAAGLDDTQRKRRLVEAARTVLLARQRERALLVVVEDLQWADPSSEEFLCALVEAMPAARMLLLCTYRSGYNPPWSERSVHQRLTLAPLSRDETSEMLKRLLAAEEIPEPVQRLVAERAEGNPFFIEELTGYLEERGILARRGTALVDPARLSEEELPQTVNALLTARIDRLPEPLKRTLQLASVVGREFRSALL